MLRHPLRFLRDHRFTARHASDHVNGELDEPGRARVEAHARLCPKCHELLASMRRTVAAIRELRTSHAEPAGSEVAERVIGRLRAARD